MTIPVNEGWPPELIRGVHIPYRWIQSNRHGIDHLITICPWLFTGKYLAVTSCDSGPLPMTEQQRHAGWKQIGGVVYSPRIVSVDTLPIHPHYDEWYLFATPAEIGALQQTRETSLENVISFVNHGHIWMDEPKERDLVSRFWEYIDLIKPESYIAESDHCWLTFATKDNSFFEVVNEAFSTDRS